MLYICPTPVGNLEDITLRTLKVLQDVDEIYCEDTRRTIKLLNHYDIKKPLFSLHEHNEKIKKSEVLSKLIQGKNIAYVSDAGMPGISDPGSELISYVIENNLDVTTLPGACAMVVALVNSGLSTKSFCFIGFLERENGRQIKQLQDLLEKKETLIIYESPHRIKKTLKNIYETLGNRNIVIAREISKKFEEYIRGSLEEINDKLRETELLGELIIVVEGNKEEKDINISDDEIKIQLSKYMLEMSKKDAVKLLSKELGISKNRVYDLSLNIWDSILEDKVFWGWK